MAKNTASPDEVARFHTLAEEWWDAEGDFKPLHGLNPCRLSFLRDALIAHFGREETAVVPFAGLTLLDVGCGGGLLSEPLCRLGFAVTGIDPAASAIAVAEAHARQSGLSIDYHCAGPEQIDRRFDVVIAMEVLEHVPDADAFLAAAADRVTPGGALFAATLNRTLKSFALAIVGAEYLLGWLPRGTHRWQSFVKPSELARGLRRAGIAPKSFEGLRYDPLHDRWRRCALLEVNYMVYGVKGYAAP
jgi:2-polyprenyl-6-hydroxyphenyl methylase/3-demethylubiquinone-9 3-methyltransferase